MGVWGKAASTMETFRWKGGVDKMEVGRVGVWGKKLPLWTPFWRFLERECRDETDRWILG